MKNLERKIEKLIEEAFHFFNQKQEMLPAYQDLLQNNQIPAIVKTPENEKSLGDPSQRANQTIVLLSHENPDREHMLNTLNHIGFTNIATTQPYVGKPLDEKDRLLIANGNALLHLQRQIKENFDKNPEVYEKELRVLYDKLANNEPYNFTQHKLPKY